jgi:hypothetical protein
MPSFNSGGRFALALGLAIATVVLIFTFLGQYSWGELLALPGLFVGTVLTPDGVHGSLAKYWWAAVAAGNVAFWTLEWWLALRAFVANGSTSSEKDQHQR